MATARTYFNPDPESEDSSSSEENEDNSERMTNIFSKWRKIQLANFPNPLPRETDNTEMYSHCKWTTIEYILLDKKNFSKTCLGFQNRAH